MKLEVFGNLTFVLLGSFLVLIYETTAISRNSSHRKARNPEKCFESAVTVTPVASCPRNSEEFLDRVSKKGCYDIKHNCGSFVYHCVINEWMTELIEVCAPPKIIVGMVCAEYNSAGMIIQRNPNAACTQCPPVYSSPNCFLYPECYTYVRDYLRLQNRTTSPSTEDLGSPKSSHSHSYNNLVTSIYLTSSTTLKTFKKDKNDASGSVSNTRKWHEENVGTIIILSVLLLIAAVLVGTCWITLRKRSYLKVPVVEYLRKWRTENN
uniref:Uncharacterized protein LOC111100059 n=1 Tax=Crassostrea virginica TaxID=6565 RepID=A0A8B8ABR2_CRAVI|nr:uncharacterized protein LOC111100059 [Crassostrea virginica]